jgi:3D-(3,5/4)-trihydroxycyclohexane-1,2-dione acylhydrolase (decyclizing)
VLQQIEDFDDGTHSVTDCFRPVSRYFDRISRPEHLLTALPRAMRVMTDPADCGPVTLAFCQDVQAEAYDYPASFFEPKTWRIRQPHPDPRELADLAEAIQSAKSPVLISGGGVIYANAEADLAAFAKRHNIPYAETQAGKGANDWRDPLNFGSPGVTGSDCANALCAKADLIIGVGTRFQDFTTGSWTAFANPARKLASINLAAYDAAKHGATPIVGDAKVVIELLGKALGSHRAADPDFASRDVWFRTTDNVMAAPLGKAANALPSDAQVIGAVQRHAGPSTIVMCAAGTMPGALQVLWRSTPGGYHMEYGYSCMGYELAGSIGIAMAARDKEVVCFVGDGSYMMANSELVTAAMLNIPFTVVLTDNRGYGCINRLQQACGGAEFNNMYKDSLGETPPEIDFVAHARAMGAEAVKVEGIRGLEAELARKPARRGPRILVVDTEAVTGAGVGGGWWDVVVPEVGDTESLRAARKSYDESAALQRAFD